MAVAKGWADQVDDIDMQRSWSRSMVGSGSPPGRPSRNRAQPTTLKARDAPASPLDALALVVQSVVGNGNSRHGCGEDMTK
jgi:hypothetical protein